MQVKIKETNEVETFEIIDPRTGNNYIADFIGNTGALSDGQFEYDDEQDVYVCDQATFDWWVKVIDDNQKLEDRIYELSQEHGGDAVYDVIASAGSVDLEDHAANINTALDDVFNK